METDRILGILREHEAVPRADGVLHLRLFGSVARGENTAASDVELLADFDPSRPLMLFTLAKIEYRLDELLGTKVDLSAANLLGSQVSTRALAEAVVAS